MKKFGLRRGNYKYIYYVGFAPELFDLEKDPKEEYNLAAEPNHRQLLEEFETLLRGIVEDVGLFELIGQSALDRELGVGTPAVTQE